jgi:hypothetical protein
MIDKFEREEEISEMIKPRYLVTRKSNQPFNEKFSVYLR